MNRFLLFFSILLIGYSYPIFSQETSRSYYFSNEGNDDNDGSINSPWKTLEKATEISKATNKGGILKPGDQVLFRSGDTFEGQLIFSVSGTEAKPILIGHYGEGELPILSGSGNIPNGDYHETIKMINISHVTLDGLWVKNNRKNKGNLNWATNNSIGIKVIANKWGGISKGLTFRNLKLTDIFGIDMIDWEGKFTLDYYSAHGIFLDSEANDLTVNPIKEIGIEDVLIEDCYFYNIGSRGITSRHLTNIRNNPIDDEDRNKNFIIRNNTFEQLGADGIVLSSVYNALVEHNDFIDLGWGDHRSSTDLYFGRGEGCWIWNARNVIVQFNKQYRARGFGDTYGAAGHIDFFTKNAIYQYNYSEDTEGGFVEILGDCVNSTFRYNVSVNDGQRDFHGYSLWVSGFVGKDVEPVRSDSNFIYNNTVYLDKEICQPDISIFAKNTYIYNNIFKVKNGAAIGADGVEIDIEEGSELIVDNNLFFGDISTDFTDLDNNKIIDEDPEFINEGTSGIDGYQIKESSPAVNVGRKIPEPSFPMAGKGIFKHISIYTATDIYGNEVDVRNLISNIGADNNFNEDINAGPSLPVSSVLIENEVKELIIGEENQCVAQVLPLNATNKKVTWTSSDPSIATVDQTGKVKALAEGTVKVTVTTEEGNFTSSINITIKSDSNGEVLGVDDPSFQSKVYPNPTTGKVMITSAGNHDLAIYSVFGKLKFKNKFSDTLFLDLNNYITGTYILVITNEKGVSTTHKLVIY
ncbi:Ig-like domain-containing protein [Flammeovirga sp. SubArs3]|uniref:Ig-like domain-containing protein n=1 Tax=Flammeovirga sp. SubArs3 TaxID=2995316 RepID=UPI00248BB9B2|nr:Ig-like domain-containing protein [Flammeovirga sp. SubArs3]